MSKIITEKILTYEITQGKNPERIDTFLANQVDHASRSKIQKLIKATCVKVNDKLVIKPNHVIVPGDLVVLTIPISPRPETHDPEDIPIDIVYEDEHIIIVNKAAGIVVHPSLGNYTGTLVNALLFHTQNLSDTDEDFRPGIVHRIDKDTSGLLLIAKDDWIHSQLAKQFAAHTVEREYWAVCWGLFNEKKGEIVGNIARSKKDRKVFTVAEDEGKHAHTFYEVIEEYEFCSLIKLKLKTGRTHQIRVHLSHINHPIFGDHTYGGRRIVCGSSLPKIKARVENLLQIMDRQALHAKTLGFYHPGKDENISFNSELPQDISELINKLK